VQAIKDLIPFQQETVGSDRIRKILSLALVVGLLQTFSFTYQIVQAPEALAATTYAPAAATSLTIPTGVSSISFTMYGGGGGYGGLDCGAGCTLKIPGARGKVTGTFTVAAGDVVGIFPGYAATSGFGSTNGGGGSGGLDTYDGGNYNGGNGGNAGSAGSSGGGGGGGAASVLTKNSSVWAVAGGAAGAGGSANLANSGQNGNDENSSSTGTTNGGNGVQTLNVTNNGPGKSCTIQTNDGGGGGGGGGGVNGGSGGNLTNAGSGECSGLAGFRGGNSLNAAITSTTNGTDASANTSNGAIEITMQLSTPSSITTSGSIQSFTVSWATAAAAQSFSLKIYNAAGNSLLQTVSVASGTYTKTITNADFSSIASGTSYQVSVTAIGNNGAPYADSAESSKVSVTTSAPSDIDSALSLNGTNQYASTPDNSALDITGDFSGAAWVYPTSANATGTVFGKWSAYMLQAKNGTWHYWLQGTTSWTGVNTLIPVVANEWQHVAMTRAAGSNQVNFYFNGNLVYAGTADTVGTGNINNSSASFVVGSHNTNADFFPGQIDEVKVWNSVRTQTEIQSDLKTYGGSGLVAYYDFNDLIGTTLLNRASGGSSSLDLTIVNTPTISSTLIIDSTAFQAYTVVKFMRTFLVAGAGWLSPAAPKRIQYFVVGGGGGGGNNVGGGGAGGGNYKVTNSSLLTNTRVSITVGVGGYGGLYSAGSLTVDGTTRMDGQNGDSSTVTVGANTYIGGGGSGGQTYWSTNFCGGSGAPSTYSTAGSFSGTGGIGTSGGLGGSPSGTSSVANGKTGYADSITGTSSFYGAGGGAGFWSGDGGKVAGTGANSIAGNGGSANGVVGASATKNTGAGGGGGGSGCAMGGRGSSGIVVLRYITNDPSITTQPTSDTTTVGTVDTLTVGTTSLPTPLTKSVTWQFTSETTTAAASATWQNVALGTGLNTDTYTTQVLTIGMNKYRYRAIVTFTDIDSLTVIETTTVVTLTVNPAITITSDTSTITRKYGDAQSVRTIVYSGGTTNTGAVGTSTSHTVRGQVGNLASGRIYIDTSTSTAVFRVDTRTAVGTYVETITVTDAKGATASYAQRVVVTAGDTLTVQADTLTAMTYSPSGLVISPTNTLTGLVSGDTRDSLTFTYSSKNVTCANGGTCAVGDTGPGGGIVFYSVNGKYLEAAPAAWFGTATDTRTVWGCSGSTYASAYATAIGTGKANTDQIVSNCGDPTSNVAAKIARAYTGGGKSDWSLPSRDELIELCKYARTQTTGNISTSCTTSGTLNAGVLKGFGNVDNSQYWSSSDGSTVSAYTVWLDGGLSGGFGGKTNIRYIRPVRYFTSDLYAANSCAAGGTCAVGDIGPAGGVVFYVSNSGSINSVANVSEGGTYLEAAPSPFSATTYNWCEGSSNPYTTLLGASGSAIGTGAANTATALASCTGGAIYQAANLTSGGYSDWFLPSSNELSQMYIWRNSIGLSPSALYWGSTENANWIAASLVMSNGGIGSQNKGQATPYWPIRAFSQVLPASQSYGPTTTPPTNAGTYTVTPSNLTLTSGILTSNYASINYLSSDFTINKASQDALTITSNLASYNGGTSTMKLTTAGGSDTGTVTYSVVSGGSASGCSVSTNVLSFSSVGTCRLTATKAATLNYLIAYSDTVTITLSAFVSSQQVQTQSVPTQLPISGANSLETTTVTAALLTITNVVTISSGSYTVTGTGFTNVSIVRIGGTDLVLNTNYTVPSATTISITNADGLVGPLFISLSDGQQVVRFEFPS